MTAGLPLTSTSIGRQLAVPNRVVIGDERMLARREAANREPQAGVAPSTNDAVGGHRRIVHQPGLPPIGLERRLAVVRRSKRELDAVRLERRRLVRRDRSNSRHSG